MPNVFKSEKFKSLLPYLILAVAVVVAYKAVNEISFFTGAASELWRIISPFFYGFLLAYIINMPCNGVQRLLEKTKAPWVLKRKRALSIILVFIIIALLLSLVLNLVIPAVYSSVSYFIANFSTYYGSSLEFIEHLNSLHLPGVEISVEAILEQLRDMVQGFSLDDLSTSVKAIVGVSAAIFRGFLAFISSIYILHEKEKCKAYLCRMLRAFLPAGVYGAFIMYVAKLNRNFKQYLYTQTIDGCILGVIATIELYILKSPFFLLLGIMLGVVNYIPYFGSIIGSLVAVVIVAFTQGVTTGVITAVVLLVTQQIDANFIQPRLMGGSFSLSPFLIVVSITVGGALAGVLGMIAAIPIVSVLRDMLESIIAHFERRRSTADTE